MRTRTERIAVLEELIAANLETLNADSSEFENYEEYTLNVVEAKQNLKQFKAQLAELEAG